MKRASLMQKWSQMGISAKVPKLNIKEEVPNTVESKLSQIQRNKTIDGAYETIVTCRGIVDNLIQERDILLEENRLLNVSSAEQLSGVETIEILDDERVVERVKCNNLETVTSSSSFEWRDDEVINSCKLSYIITFNCNRFDLFANFVMVNLIL